VTATVAELGEPKVARPATEVREMLNVLPAALLAIGIETVLGAVSPATHVRVPPVAV
jgi:hypothetical protein